MKSLVIYLAILLGSSNGTDHFNTSNQQNRSALKQMVWQQIQSQLSVPEALIGQMAEGEVEISIAIRKDHKIEVLELKSEQMFTEIQLRKALSEVEVFIPKEVECPNFTFTLKFQLP